MPENNTLNIFHSTGENADLSNFAIRPFIAGRQGIRFDSVEQAFQYCKTFYSDAPQEQLDEMRRYIRSSVDGSILKHFGQSIPGLRKQEWDARAYDIMKSLVTASFTQNPDAMKRLLETGDAKLTHTQDHTRWSEDFPKILMEVRKAHMKELDNTIVPAAVGPVAPENAIPLPKSDAFDTSSLPEAAAAYDILTLGVSKHTSDELLSLIPEGTTMVVDTRRYRASSKNPTMSEEHFGASVVRHGIKYQAFDSMSGKTNDPAFFVDGNKNVIDFEKYSQTEGYKAEYDTLKSHLANDEKIVLISSERNPALSARALLLGQMLDRDGVKVGHIAISDNNAAYIASQANVVQAAIGKNMRIIGGDYNTVNFDSDRSYTLPEGVSVRRSGHPEDAPAEERLLQGNWNYGTPVEVTTTDGNATSLTTAYTDNARDTDITLLFSMGKASRDERIMFSASAGNTVKVSMFDKFGFDGDANLSLIDMLRDPGYAAEKARLAAQKMRDKMDWIQVSRMYAGDDDVITDLKLNVIGSSLPRIVNEARTNSPNILTGTEISSVKGDGSGDAYHIDAYNQYHIVTNDIRQEDINFFMTNFMSALNGFVQDKNFMDNANDEFEPERDRTFRITEIRSVGDTGVGEAAVIAAQSLGMKASVHTSNYAMTIDNETARGLLVTDRALFENRFHLGLHHDVTLDDLKADIQKRADLERIDIDNAMTPGLSREDIVTLSLMTFNNSDLNTMITVANVNRVFITNDSDLLSFIQDCSGYGIECADFINENYIAKKRAAAKELISKAAERGIGVVSVNDREYPENLSQYAPDSIEDFRKYPVVEINNENNQSVTLNAYYERFMTRDERPALLWYYGNLSQLSETSVSIHGNRADTDDAVNIARATAGNLVANNVAAVVNLSENVATAAARESADRGGKVVAVTTDAPDGPYKSDLKDDIVKNGGVVVSETPPDLRDKEPVSEEVKESLNKEAAETKQDAARASKIAATLGYAGAVIEGAVSGMSLTPAQIAGTALYDVFAISELLAKGIHRIAVGKKDSKDEKQNRGESASEGQGEKNAQDNKQKVENRSVDDIANCAKRNHDGGVAETVGKENVRYNKHAAAAEDRPLDPDTCTIEALSFHGENIYFVPENFPGVRAALKAKMGDNIRVMDPKERNIVFGRLTSRTVMVDGESIQAVPQASGAQPLLDEPESSRLYYNKGTIYTENEVYEYIDNLKSKNPKYTDNQVRGFACRDFGVAEPWIAKGNRDLFDNFRSGALAIQDEMMNTCGITGDRQFRFEDADYIVVKRDSVEIRRGENVRASISYVGGKIQFKENSMLASDLEEYAQRQFKIFSQKTLYEKGPDGKMSYAAVKRCLDEMRDCVMDRVKGETEYLSPRDREHQEEMDEKIKNGFIVVRKPNIDIAMKEYAEFQIEMGDRISPDKALAMIDRELAATQRSIKKLDTDIRKEQRMLKKCKDDGEVDEIEARLDDLVQSRLKSVARATLIKTCREDLLQKGAVSSMRNLKNGEHGIDISGCVIPIYNTSPLKKSELTAAAMEVGMTQAAQNWSEGAKRVTDYFVDALYGDDGEDKTEKTTKKRDILHEIVEDEAEKETRKRVEAKAGEIKKEASAKKRGKKAAEGKKQVKPVVEQPKPVQAPVPDMTQRIKNSIESGQIVLHDGWGLVKKKEDGKYNFVNAEGQYMTDNWFDKAAAFKDGIASVERDGIKYEIGRDAKVITVIEEGIGKRLK